MKTLFSVHNFDKSSFNQIITTQHQPTKCIWLVQCINSFWSAKYISHSEFEVAPYPEIIVRYCLIPIPNFMLLPQCAQFSCYAARLYFLHRLESMHQIYKIAKMLPMTLISVLIEFHLFSKASKLLSSNFQSFITTQLKC